MTGHSGPLFAIIAFMTKRIALLFLVLQTVQARSNVQSPECNGVIHGAVFGSSGERVKGIKVQTSLLGVDGSFVLPRAKTDQEGEYRFQNICPGRYAVVADDEKAGYPDSSPQINEFLYGFPITEVRLTAKNPQAELPVFLPPKPGFIQVHVINRETKAEVLKFSVKLKVPGQQRRAEISFEFDAEFKHREITVPPDKDFVCRVTADGFHEWSESAGPGALIRVPSGTRTTIEIELEPLK